MAISQVGGITYINQNIQLNAQLQANNINHFNVHSLNNLDSFNDKVNKSIEVRETEGIEKVGDQTSRNKQQYEENENNRELKEDDLGDSKKDINQNSKTYSSNIYDNITLDIEV